MIYDEAIKKLKGQTDQFNDRQVVETLDDYKKFLVRRFDLAIAQDDHVKRYFPDYTIPGTDDERLLQFVWNLFFGDRDSLYREYAEQLPDDAYIEQLRAEVFP